MKQEKFIIKDDKKIEKEDYVLICNNIENNIYLHEKDSILIIKDNNQYFPIFFLKKSNKDTIISIDIAKYNDKLKQKYNTAKLYESYLHLKKDYITTNSKLKNFDNKLYKTIQSKMEILKPHNPLSDCYFTVIILLIMNKL